jgi:uncharacterized membrane protein
LNETGSENMREKNQNYESSEDRKYRSKAINQLAIGLIISIWGGLLALKQVGIIDKNISTLPFVFTAFGVLLIFGGIYRLMAREKISQT